MRAAPLILLALAACASPRPGLPPPPPPAADPATGQVVLAGPQSRDDHIVAFINGQPVTWRQVVEHAMQTNAKQLIDQYVHWKIRQDRIRQLGLANTREELRARAKLIVEAARKAKGNEAVEAALRAERITEEQYVDRFASDPRFAERLLLEKAYMHELLSRGMIEVDVIAFMSDEDANAFVAEVRRGIPFARAAEVLFASGAKGRISQWPRHRLARGFMLDTLAHLEERLFSMQEGGTTPVERTSKGLAVVAHLVRRHPPLAGRADEAIMQEILRSPPTDEQLKVWQEAMMSTIKYEDRYSTRDKK